ncbi:FHA domain-containing protein [Rhizobium lemnae]|uniref:FHA domain-containing protein n=1 Tax=Rhizobium lemnae TaxID=1214924 RepID=A0ABV8EDQ3_9HYPH|nr:FHA domain-containing protein [Rhizobium lemnae]MCJ8510230.1 FHA domain-containing protein [Rhizobium lemnae]
MRLELIPQTSNPSSLPHRWIMERGRRKIGRSIDCDWQLPENERSVSNIHCLIERESDSFVLLDRSSNGSQVDGVWLHDGAKAELHDASVIALGTFSFTVTIQGESKARQEDPDSRLALSPESLTVSSILSDIVPAGHMADGVLGPRELEDPFAFIQQPKSDASSSRNVSIGWPGPPRHDLHGKLLPDNWWEDPETDNRIAHALEHSPATRVSVSVNRIGNSGSMTGNPTQGELSTSELSNSFATDFANIAQLTSQLKQLEVAMEQAFGTLQIPLARPLSREPACEDEGALNVRLEKLLACQLRLNAALEHLFEKSGHLFDPRLLEARIDVQAGRTFAAFRNASYWRHYRRQFEADGRVVSAADLLRATYLTGEQEERAGLRDASEEGKRPDEI